MFDSENKRFIEFIWSLEEKYDLLNLEVEGIKIWQAARFRIYTELSSRLKIVDSKSSKDFSLPNLIRNLSKMLFKSIFGNPMCRKRKVDGMIFNSGRKFMVDGKLIDPYIDPLLPKLGTTSYEIVDGLSSFKHVKGYRQTNLSFDDAQFLRAILRSKFKKIAFDQRTKELISTVKDEIAKRWGIAFDLEGLLMRQYLIFESNYAYYHKLLKKRAPKFVLQVCAYDHKKALTAAAKELGIVVIEMQHGTIGKYHMGYSYPKHDAIAYFPDHLWIWGEYWLKDTPIPLNSQHIVRTGFPYLEERIQLFKAIPKKPKQVLIISQGTIGRAIFAQMAECYEKLKEYEFIIKLHPGEYARWKEEYEDLVMLSRQSNIKVVESNDIPLYQWMAESAYVIGVYSTAIYESFCFDCKVLLLDLPGIEHMQGLIENDYALVLNHFCEFTEACQRIDHTDTTKLKDSLFYQNEGGNALISGTLLEK